VLAVGSVLAVDDLAISMSASMFVPNVMARPDFQEPTEMQFFLHPRERGTDSISESTTNDSVPSIFPQT